MMCVMLLWVCIHTGQAWKICLATVGIEPTTFGILAQYIHTGQAWKICLATVGIEPIRPLEYYSPIILCFYVFSSKYFVYKLTTPLMKSNVYVDEASVLK